MFNIDIITTGTLALLVARSGAKLENTALSTGGSKAPVYDYIYIAQLHFENKKVCNQIKKVFGNLQKPFVNIKTND